MKARRDALRDAVAATGARGPSPAGEYRILCPYCERRVGTPDRKACLSANPSRRAWNCHRCGAAARDVDLSWLGPSDGAAPARRAEPVAGELGPPPGFVPFSAGAIAGAPFAAYLRGRGVYDAAAEAGAGFCLDGPYAWRAVVPLLGVEGVWLGFSARTIGRGEPKYLYPAGMRRGEVLYNESALAVAVDAPVFVVEGVLDALHLWPDAVAVLGKATDKHVERIAAAARPVVVALDGDAWRDGLELALRLRGAGARAVALRFSPRTDPDEVPAAQLRSLAGEALAEVDGWA